jgi:hydrogenase maturation protein HypF
LVWLAERTGTTAGFGEVMKTYHIHISGQVQGVGFRPYVYQLAEKMDVKGWVSNSNDGVHIEFSAKENMAAEFYQSIIQSPPLHAIITHHQLDEIPYKEFSSFWIKESTSSGQPNLLFTPDIAICDECRKEVLNNGSRWYHYPFTTCLHCGPRYSIIDKLPYDRLNTSMAPFEMCKDCAAEYNDVHNRRHYSQTISCPHCAVPMHLYNSSGEEIQNSNEPVLLTTTNLLSEGKIVAVKGIGGYLLLCDATNELAVSTLRQRKHRPAKPFALLYPGIDLLKQDTDLSKTEIESLQSDAAPIVLCRLKEIAQTKICAELIAPGLQKIGVMLPYTPLLLLISTAVGKPLIATSGNISGAPIIYKDKDALASLSGIADHILTYEREIVVPQDDSVVQFTPADQKIVLRRSRGLAPTYYPNPFDTSETVLAIGGELKSAFAIAHQQNLYVSQFLGDQAGVESQDAYTETLEHLLKTLKAKPERILVDKHPGYFVSLFGKEKAAGENIPCIAIQHHEAHFGAVLAENNLLQSNEPVLGVIWDGTGYGDDEQIWGGEFFIYEEGEINRVAHLDYFPQLLGDKMSKEPRLSALSLLKNFTQKQDLIQKHFSEKEWEFYQKQIQQPGQLLTSSMGRFLDGLSSILGICQLNSYEGEAAMKLEALAFPHRQNSFEYYPIPLSNNRLEHNVLLPYIFEDLEKSEDISLIAWKVFCSLAKVIENAASHFDVNRIAFSGGVFQNELLVHLVMALLSEKKQLFFHQQLSPNDECIGFGQIACYEILKAKQSTYNRLSTAYAG